MPDVSFIICAHNCLKLTESMLDSLFKHTELENRELILVDDASTDGTAEYLKSIKGSPIVLTNQANFGFGTNWLYVLVPRTDLEKGDLSRLASTGANS